jgi:hypothetical protein
MQCACTIKQHNYSADINAHRDGQAARKQSWKKERKKPSAAKK